MRQTVISKTLNQIFERHDKPLTTKAVLELLQKQGLRPNKTTIYRQLEKLVSKNLVQKIQIKEDAISYERVKNHHHHIICDNCGEINDIVIKNEERLFNNAIKQIKNFIITNHKMEFFGLCIACSKKQS